jgi:drug/metabolite transporter (DMT)-like permease
MRIKTAPIPRKHEYLFAFSGVALAVHFATWIASLLYTSIAVSTLLVCTAPVWTALYDTFICKREANWRFWCALLGALCGVALIVRSGSGDPPVPGQELMGDVLAALGGVAFATYLIAIRAISNLYPTLVIVGRTYSWSAVSLIIAAIVFGQPPPVFQDATSWSGIVAMSVFSQGLGHTGMNACLQWFAPSTVASSTLLEPICAAILAAVFFHEQLSIQTIAGSVVVLLALAVILRFQPAETARQTALDGNEL